MCHPDEMGNINIFKRNFGCTRGDYKNLKNLKNFKKKYLQIPKRMI